MRALLSLCEDSVATRIVGRYQDKEIQLLDLLGFGNPHSIMYDSNVAERGRL